MPGNVGRDGMGCRAPGEDTFAGRETFPPLYLKGRRRALDTWTGRFGRRILKECPVMISVLLWEAGAPVRV